MDRIDLRVIACVILLSVFGLIMIYSASAYSCSTLAKYNYDSLYLLKKQGIFVLAGIVVMLLLQYFNYNYLQKLAPVSYTHLFAEAVGSTEQPDPDAVKGFETFIASYKQGLGVEQKAVEIM